MRRIKVLGLAVLGVLAISAVVATAASAEIHWWVENNTRTGSEALAAGTKAEFSELFNVVPGKSSIKIKEIVTSCSELTLLNKAGAEIEGAGHLASESFIEGTNGGKVAGAQFSECKVTNPATGCKLLPVKPGEDEGDITTQEEVTPGTWEQVGLGLALKEVGGKAMVTFTPGAPHTAFAELKFGNETACKTLKGLTIKVSGETQAEIQKPAECLQGHNLLISEKPSKLKAAGAAVEEFVLELETEGLETNGKGLESNVCWDAK
jgi:hypothetical protein